MFSLIFSSQPPWLQASKQERHKKKKKRGKRNANSSCLHRNLNMANSWFCARKKMSPSNKQTFAMATRFPPILGTDKGVRDCFSCQPGSCTYTAHAVLLWDVWPSVLFHMSTFHSVNHVTPTHTCVWTVRAVLWNWDKRLSLEYEWVKGTVSSVKCGNYSAANNTPDEKAEWWNFFLFFFFCLCGWQQGWKKKKRDREKGKSN